MKNKFFDLLISNNKEKIHEYIIINGKSKPFCPIRFINKEEEDHDKDKPEYS